MFQSVLVANRGAIAVRIIKTLKKLGVKAIAVYSEADAHAPHVSMADEAYSLGDGRAADTYLNTQKLLQMITTSGAQAVHPGYGFLSENVEFCQLLEQHQVAFIGPTPEQIQSFGLKHEARALAQSNAVPLVPGSELLTSLEQALAEADRIGYPVMLKSTAGGGGIGMKVCHSSEEIAQNWQTLQNLGANNFNNSGLFLEKYIKAARHIEVQVFGDGQGDVLILGDRDCSSQRRHQKVIEEAPASNIPDTVRRRLHAVAKTLTAAVNYRNAGTVEFIYDQNAEDFYFLEVNTRLQVEHGVTELIYGVDIVAWMVQLAAGDLAPLSELNDDLNAEGHAVQVRIYAENANKDFQPSTGVFSAVHWPEGEGVRIDHWVCAGTEVTPFYDPMLAKVMVYANSREQAIEQLSSVLEQCTLQGVVTNCEYVAAVLADEVFTSGKMTTRYLTGKQYPSKTLEVLESGTQTTVQDYPGRVGYWDVGVPPSGPFDARSFRIGNALLGNATQAPGLECTLNGPTLKFHCDQTLVLTGAKFNSTLDEKPVEFYTPFTVKAGQILTVGKANDAGARCYVLFAGGLKVAPYLDSAATFTLGQFGGLTGAALQLGDVLPVASKVNLTERALAPDLQPVIKKQWTLQVIMGPHSAPDFFTPEDIDNFLNAEWKVHYNSSRTGVRLIGPKPTWARSDGGEAGLHPSNIHDNAYAIGAVDFTGDMPVILGPDGPSLGGFVCPVTVISADLWKLGQLVAGDSVRFVVVAPDQAVSRWQKHNANVLAWLPPCDGLALGDLPSPVIHRLEKNEQQAVEVVYRRQGDQNILVEYGPLQLDIRIRFQVHALLLWIEAQKQQSSKWQAALVDLTPGVRSLQVHFDPLQVDETAVLELLLQAEDALNEQSDLTVPSRVVHLPLSWDDEACRLAVEKYDQSVRKDAPWSPDNIEFIRRINGLDSAQAVKDIVFNAKYVVLGLGDVYLGAPVATPLDPRHRLVTTKYNPARTWTAENSVGIGGSYLCVYGMEGPGGYQFVGRTLQMWNRYNQTPEFERPWLLRFFDQIQFYEVSADALGTLRKKFPAGQAPIRIENTQFSLADYETFLAQNTQEITQFTQQRNQAFEQELQRWVDTGQLHFEVDANQEAAAGETDLTEREHALVSPVSGSVWQWQVQEGDHIKAGDVICVLESMKMEIDVPAPVGGVVKTIIRQAGQTASANQILAIIED